MRRLQTFLFDTTTRFNCLGNSGYTTTVGPAVDCKHTSVSAAFVYPYDSVTDLYVVFMDDRVEGQTKGTSLAAGTRLRF